MRHFDLAQNICRFREPAAALCVMPCVMCHCRARGQGEQLSRKVEDLRDEASRYRRMADAESDVRAVSELLNRAFELDSQAAELEARPCAQRMVN